MIVTAVRAYRVRVRPTDPIRTGRGPVPERADLLVELVTDDGRSGWGNGSDSETGIAALAGDAPHVLGVDLHRTDPRSLWPTLSETLPIGPLSAVDTALWDLRGQALGQSVASLLGAESGHVRPAGSRLRHRPLPPQSAGPPAEHARELVLEAEGYAAAGYTTMKLKTGFGLDADTRHTAAIRHAIGPEIALYVDSNAAYTPAAVHRPRRGNHRLRCRLDGRAHWANSIGPAIIRSAPRSGGSPRRSPSLAGSSSAQRATSPLAATPRRGTWSSPTLFRPAVSPACGAWVS